MDRVLSTRLDESLVDQLTRLARLLHVSKKHVLEKAISRFAETVNAEEHMDVFDRTFGAWHRQESAAASAHHAHAEFRRSMKRHRA